MFCFLVILIEMIDPNLESLLVTGNIGSPHHMHSPVSDKKLIILQFVRTFFWIIFCFLCTDSGSKLNWQVIDALWFYWSCSTSCLIKLVPHPFSGGLALFWKNQSVSIYCLADKGKNNSVRMEVITCEVLCTKWFTMHCVKSYSPYSTWYSMFYF